MLKRSRLTLEAGRRSSSISRLRASRSSAAKKVGAIAASVVAATIPRRMLTTSARLSARRLSTSLGVDSGSIASKAAPCEAGPS